MSNATLQVSIPHTERSRYTEQLRTELQHRVNDATIIEDAEALDYLYLLIAGKSTRSDMVNELSELFGDSKLATGTVDALFAVFGSLAQQSALQVGHGNGTQHDEHEHRNRDRQSDAEHDSDTRNSSKRNGLRDTRDQHADDHRHTAPHDRAHSTQHPLARDAHPNSNGRYAFQHSPHHSDVRDVRYQQRPVLITRNEAPKRTIDTEEAHSEPPKRKKLLVVTKRQQQQRHNDQQLTDNGHDDVRYDDIVPQQAETDDALQQTRKHNGTNDKVTAVLTEPKPDVAKCRFYPKCEKSDCPFFHPTTECPYFPKCKFGRDCIYIHPMCKFDANCTNIKCPYQHTVQFKAVPSVPPCKFGAHCTNPHCTFKHPYGHKKRGSAVDKDAAKHIPCKFDTKCTNLNCPYMHTNRQSDANGQPASANTQTVHASITQLDQSLPRTPTHDT